MLETIEGTLLLHYYALLVTKLSIYVLASVLSICELTAAQSSI